MHMWLTVSVNFESLFWMIFVSLKQYWNELSDTIKHSVWIKFYDNVFMIIVWNELSGNIEHYLERHLCQYKALYRITSVLLMSVKWIKRSH